MRLFIKITAYLMFIYSGYHCKVYSQDFSPINTSNINSEIFNREATGGAVFEDPDQQSVVTVLPRDGIHSRHSAPQTLFRFARCYYLITAAEMFTSGFPAGVNITSLGFNYKYGTTLATKGYFKVYFQNTNDNVNNKSLNWYQAIQEMTLVHSDTVIIPATSGPFDIPLNSSGDFTYNGGGIYIAFEYSNPAGPLSSVSNVAWCNMTLPNPIQKSSQSDDSIRVIATGTSKLRAETRFGCNKTDIVTAGPVYALGVTGVWPSPDSVSVRAVINHVRDFSDTIIVTTKIKNINQDQVRHLFTDTIISSERGSIIINHKYMSEALIHTDSVIVSAVASGEYITGNNKAVYIQQTSVNSWNHYIPSMPPIGGTGFNVGTGDFVARFHTPVSLTVCAVDLSFFAESGWGQNPYKILFYAADGPGGLPGTLLHISPGRVTPVALTGFIKKSTYFLTVPLVISPGYYYAGYSQPEDRILRVSYQTESPVRTGEYFYAAPYGAGNWTEFDEISPYRFDISPRTYMPLKMKIYLQGFINGQTVIRDTVKVKVRSQTYPFNAVDSAVSVTDTAGNVFFNLINVNSDSCYYFEIKHRNHLKTFSSSLCFKLIGVPSFYDFSVSSSQALGNNTVFVPGVNAAGIFAIYGGDVNQDGIIDASDLSSVENNAAAGLTGYANTDITGDDFTDGSDLSITENNSSAGINSVVP